MRVRTLTPLLTLIVVGILALGACGGSSNSSKSSNSTSTSSPTSSAPAGGAESKSPFCQSLGNFLTAASTAFNDSTLADLKRDFPNVVSTAHALNPAPAELRQTVSKTIADVEHLNTWIQTQATQKDLNANSVPSAIKGPYNDLQTQAKTLAAYAKSPCGIISPSSGSSGSGSSGSPTTGNS